MAINQSLGLLAAGKCDITVHTGHINPILTLLDMTQFMDMSVLPRL
jgi:hypothetical protein